MVLSQVEGALLGLSPIRSLPTSSADLEAFANNILSNGELLAGSIPPPPGGLPLSSSNLVYTRANSAKLASEMKPSQARPQARAEHERLWGSWGNRLEVSKGQSLEIPVYKFSSQIAGKPTGWLAFRTIQEGLSFEKWRWSLENEFDHACLANILPEPSVRAATVERELYRKVVPKVGILTVVRMKIRPQSSSGLSSSAKDALALRLVSNSKAFHGASSAMSQAPRQRVCVTVPLLEFLDDTGVLQTSKAHASNCVEIIREVPFVQHQLERELEKINGASKRTSQLSPTSNRSNPRESKVHGERKLPPSPLNPTGRTASGWSSPRDVGTSQCDTDINPVEWIVISRQEQSRSLSRFIGDRSPQSLLNDSTRFVNWACSIKNTFTRVEDLEDDGSAPGPMPTRVPEQPGHTPSHARQDSSSIGRLEKHSVMPRLGVETPTLASDIDRPAVPLVAPPLFARKNGSRDMSPIESPKNAAKSSKSDSTTGRFKTAVAPSPAASPSISPISSWLVGSGSPCQDITQAAKNVETNTDFDRAEPMSQRSERGALVELSRTVTQGSADSNDTFYTAEQRSISSRESRQSIVTFQDPNGDSFPATTSWAANPPGSSSNLNGGPTTRSLGPAQPPALSNPQQMANNSAAGAKPREATFFKPVVSQEESLFSQDSQHHLRGRSENMGMVQRVEMKQISGKQSPSEHAASPKIRSNYTSSPSATSTSASSVQVRQRRRLTKGQSGPVSSFERFTTSRRSSSVDTTKSIGNNHSSAHAQVQRTSISSSDATAPSLLSAAEGNNFQDITLDTTVSDLNKGVESSQLTTQRGSDSNQRGRRNSFASAGNYIYQMIRSRRSSRSRDRGPTMGNVHPSTSSSAMQAEIPHHQQTTNDSAFLEQDRKHANPLASSNGSNISPSDILCLGRVDSPSSNSPREISRPAGELTPGTRSPYDPSSAPSTRPASFVEPRFYKTERVRSTVTFQETPSTESSRFSLLGSSRNTSAEGASGAVSVGANPIALSNALKSAKRWKTLYELSAKENGTLKAQLEELQAKFTAVTVVLGKTEDGRRYLQEAARAGEKETKGKFRANR